MAEAGTIIIVDDEAGLASVLSRVLAREFDAVVRATTSPTEALSWLEEPPRAMLLDLVMPEITGCELASIVLKRWPTTPIFFVTGELRGSHGQVSEAGSMRLLYKPFRLQELVTQFSDLLDEEPRSTSTLLASLRMHALVAATGALRIFGPEGQATLRLSRGHVLQLDGGGDDDESTLQMVLSWQRAEWELLELDSPKTEPLWTRDQFLWQLEHMRASARVSAACREDSGQTPIRG